jgi:hypothetical protein
VKTIAINRPGFLAIAAISPAVARITICYIQGGGGGLTFPGHELTDAGLHFVGEGICQDLSHVLFTFLSGKFHERIFHCAAKTGQPKDKEKQFASRKSSRS